MSDIKNSFKIMSVISTIVILACGAVLIKEIGDTKELKARLTALEQEVAEKQAEIETLEVQLDAVVHDKPDVYLPERLYVAAGRTLELYNDQVASHGKIDEFAFNWECDIGKCLERKYEVTVSDEQIGEHELKLTIYNANLEPVYEKDVILEVVDDVIGEPMKVLNIGDSFSTDVPWYEEIYNLSEGQITFVGTRGWGNYKHEGRSGFSICDYRTETEYVYGREGVQPFYNPDGAGFDFAYYKETTGVEPDAVQFFLGKNGMSMDPGPGIEWLKEMVLNVRETDPDMPIYLVQTVYLGDQNGIGNEVNQKGCLILNGWWKWEEDRQIFLWTQAMEEAFGNMDGVYLIPAVLTFDSDYNYRMAEVPVNARSSVTETVLMEAMHPNRAGYMQIADTLFNTYCGTMK